MKPAPPSSWRICSSSSPPPSLWFGYDWQEQGRPLPDGFRYASDTNPQWLTVEQIREMVAPFETDGGQWALKNEAPTGEG